MKEILLDNVVKVQYRDFRKAGWLTDIHVVFDEPGQVGNFCGPGLRLALSLLEDQFQPETGHEVRLVARPVPYPIDFEISPETMALAVDAERLKDLTREQLITSTEQAKQFRYFRSEGRSLEIDGLLTVFDAALNHH